MEIEVWHLWMVAAVVFFIIEIFTPAFVVACIGVGCIAGGLASLLGCGTVAQLLYFSAFTLLSFIFVRPVAVRYLLKRSCSVRTNVDSLVGRTARVSERIDPATGSGRVMVDGDDWKAVSFNNSTIEKNELVEIVKVDSIILTIKKL
ncbi:MAG: NfeD family protein [Prevotellaceae bacterium]|jgi:membrane protein implicated in regulation of membrane protease activity|nr:NfeD family protein [Prevotellaceae bacterium]